MNRLAPRALADIIARRVRLKKTPAGWLGLCPFHREKTPSFSVFAGRQGEGRYHCHGCGADGDSIDWLRKIEGRNYREAGGDMPDRNSWLDELGTFEGHARADVLRSYRDRNPECPLPDWAVKI